MKFALPGLLLLLTLPSVHCDGHDPAWHYSGSSGPLNWHLLKPDGTPENPSWAACHNGHRQSPIDLTGAYYKPSHGAEDYYYMKIDYPAHSGKFVMKNTGHTMEFSPHPDSQLEYELKTYNQEEKNETVWTLVNFHFHTPGEHLAYGRGFPMELHFVHQDMKDKMGKRKVVLGLLIDIADCDEPLHDGTTRSFLKYFCAEQHATQRNQCRLLPFSRSKLIGLKDDIENIPLNHLNGWYSNRWFYFGSLTTPPCSENVGWYVWREVQKVDRYVYDMFQSIMGFNSRFVQYNKDANPAIHSAAWTSQEAGQDSVEGWRFNAAAELKR
ncbi:carbonic anhydrase [Wilcoxina mikolae CBS 423.85]|nr:carbonic anhydrase [Wilcoxina mikolae CBS 423.85]